MKTEMIRISESGNIKRKLSIAFFFCLLINFCFAQPKDAVVKEYQQSFTTYPFSDPNPIPLMSPVYPYFRYDGFTNTPVKKIWKVVELENDYIRLLILPEIGGKIWAAIEKTSNRPFIYYNHVVKFRDVAMRGPWTSGGLEANYGIIGHTPNCATPVDYITKQNDDGSVSCFIGVLDLLSRAKWRVEINLPKDKAYFTTASLWYNTTPQEQPYYHWMNVGLKSAGNLELIYPGNKYIGHEGEFSDWPIHANGKNLARYEENNFGGYKSYHVFGKYTDFFGAYWHDDKFGMVKYSTHDDKPGKKIWIWGLSRQGMIWERLLTDNDGQYVEVQTGRLFNQNSEGSSYTPFKHRSLEPFATETWKEYWYPVLKTEGISEANELGAMNLKNRNGFLILHFSPVQFFQDTLEVKEGTRIIYNKAVNFKPLEVFTDSIKITVNTENLIAGFRNHSFTYNSHPEANVLSRPVKSPASFDWNSSYGLFVLGKEAMDQKNYSVAEQKIEASLRKDSNFLPALVKMSELLYRNMRYKEALQYALHALSIDTHDGAANYFYGLINSALDNIVDAKDGFDLASLSYEYRSAAFTQLSRIYLQEKNYIRAIHYGQKALDYNRYNMEALQLLAVIHRKQNDRVKATEVLNTILIQDPLSNFVSFEKYNWEPSDLIKKQIISQVRNELPHETYLQAGIWYYNAGLLKEAENVFLMCPPSTEGSYWLSFLQEKPLNFSSLKPDFVFPFRSETADLLNRFLSKEDHWILKYHLALIYLNKNRIHEARELLGRCGNRPDYAAFYATRAAINKETPGAKTLEDLQKALSLDNQWRYHKLLTEFLVDLKQYDKALDIVEAYYRSHKGDYIMGMLYAKTLLLNKKYKETHEVLSKLQIIPFEGATDGRELYREAKLMQAVDFLQQKKYSKATALIDQSKLWPDNLGVGKPYDEDIDLRLEQWMNYLAINKTAKADQAKSLLEQITQFVPSVENTISNFQASNALVTGWAFRELQQTAQGNEWLNNQIRQFPNNKLLLWSKAKLENKNDTTYSAIAGNANVRILEQLMKIEKK